jgi:predicted AlkP superfamily pyrophosphatase or phosphodiesterase
MANSNKVVLVLSDGLRYDVAVQNMGFMGHLVESRLASLFRVTGELPTMSRPMYETVHTGLPVMTHGIYSNNIVRRSNQPNIFQSAVDAGKTTAAAAYSWFSELYNRAPYNPIDDREVDDPSLLIQHGRFYTQDEFPDIELFQTAAMLVRRFKPDYCLVHPMGMDDMGEIYGSDSIQYQKNAVRQDVLLANLVPEWMALGYHILFTADHGMNSNHFHGGTTPELRMVPLFFIQAGVAGEGDTGKTISHLQLAPTVCKLLGVPIPETMKAPPLI